jgi:drug/metabolite transporter (DMT)-like permease
LALLSALLFGVGTPLIKLRFSGIDPLLLAGLISIGSGFGVALLTRVSWNPERLLDGANRLFFGGSVTTGGIIAPFLLVWGIEHSSGSTASLLLNLEAVLTALIAWGVFRDQLGTRIIVGLVFVTVGGMVISTSANACGSQFIGSLAVSASCLCWAVDNNCTARLCNVSSAQFTLWKGLISGVVLLGTFAALRATPLPASRTIAEALLLGSCCHGFALLSFVLAIQRLGAGQTTAYFALAPFVGATVAVLVLGEPVSARLIVAAGLMACGVIALMTAPSGELQIAPQ